MTTSLIKSNISRLLVIGLSALILSSCASLFNPEPDESTDQKTDEITQMERYVKCLRRKDRKVEDPPCLLK